VGFDAPLALMEDRRIASRLQYYIQLVAVEEAFKTLKGDLAIRRSSSKRAAHRAHIFVAFLAIACRSP